MNMKQSVNYIVSSLLELEEKVLEIHKLSGLSLDNIIDLLKQGYIFTKPDKQEVNMTEVIEKYNYEYSERERIYPK